MFGNNDSEKGDQGHCNANQQRQKTMKNTENQLTVMLLLVTTLFLILMIPTYMRFLYTTFVDKDTLIPFSMLMYMNYLNIKKVRQSRKMLSTNDTQNDSQGQGQCK